jgi:hypothetical protein
MAADGRPACIASRNDAPSSGRPTLDIKTP